MDTLDAEQLTGLLQAYAIAISALFASHSRPELLRSAFEILSNRTPAELDLRMTSYPIYRQTIATLERAIP